MSKKMYVKLPQNTKPISEILAKKAECGSQRKENLEAEKSSSYEKKSLKQHSRLC